MEGSAVVSDGLGSLFFFFSLCTSNGGSSSDKEASRSTTLLVFVVFRASSTSRPLPLPLDEAGLYGLLALFLVVAVEDE